MPPILRLHLTLPEELVVAVRRRFPRLRDATAIREALEVLLDPAVQLVRLSEGLRRELGDFAAAKRLPLELALRELLRNALAAPASVPNELRETLRFNLALTRYILLLAVDGDTEREAEILRSAKRWVDENGSDEAKR